VEQLDIILIQGSVSELQNNHQQLSSQLTQARTIEIETRRNAAQLSDEIDSLRQKHRREVMELELDRSRLEREVRSLKDEIVTNEQDLRRERDVIASLKASGCHCQKYVGDLIRRTGNVITATNGKHCPFRSYKCYPGRVR
jgi:chromosome segregation ATPase